MRQSRVLSLVAGVALVAACGDDGGNGNGNERPTANFTASCNLLECTFTNSSTDPDGAGTIASYSWDFGDDSAPVTTANATHAYAAANTYQVTLTVADNEGASDQITKAVVVSSSNVSPTANFTFACTDLTCDFTDASSDADGTVQSRSWTFENGTPATSTSTNPADVTFAAAGQHTVTLTVTDNSGGTNQVSKEVTVTAPAPGGPTASFDVTCSAATCTITNTSTVPAGGTVTWAWDFGNGATSNLEDPAPVQYTVDDVTNFTITLVVTRDGASSQATRQVNVSPAATLTCGDVACTLGLDERSTVVVTLVSADCEAHGNTFLITAPVEETLFEDGCFATPGTQFTLNGGNAFESGTELAAEVRSGLAGAQTPQLRVTGNFSAGWTLEFDDGFVGAGEPDFNDLVMTVKATPTP
jgi:PKD repeat protein